MKKWLALAVLLLPGLAFAETRIDPTIWISSYVPTNHTLNVVSSGTYRLHGVVVSSPGVNSQMIVYDSDRQAASIIGTISTDSVGSYWFDVRKSSGITYTKTGTLPAAVTILYQDGY